MSYLKQQPVNIIDGIKSFVNLKAKEENARNPVTQRINAFYEENPFPNYEDFDSLNSFYDKASVGVYAKMLDEQIPLNVRILEVGCGTGQLSVFLAHSQREVVAADLCLNSLRLAKKFTEKHNVSNIELIHADIFDLPFKEGSFDFVISKGVLHHTYDCKKAFMEVARLVRPGGFFIVGLYNKYGRIPTAIRKQFYRLMPKSIDKLDYVLKNFAQSDQKRRSWILDQYANPHETWHSVDELLRWYEECNFSYVNAIPKITFSEPFTLDEKLFRKHKKGSHLERILVQLSWIFTISREGALFDIIGRKNTSNEKSSKTAKTKQGSHS